MRRGRSVPPLFTLSLRDAFPTNALDSFGPPSTPLVVMADAGSDWTVQLFVQLSTPQVVMAAGFTRDTIRSVRTAVCSNHMVIQMQLPITKPYSVCLSRLHTIANALGSMDEEESGSAFTIICKSRCVSPYVKMPIITTARRRYCPIESCLHHLVALRLL